MILKLLELKGKYEGNGEKMVRAVDKMMKKAVLHLERVEDARMERTLHIGNNSAQEKDGTNRDPDPTIEGDERSSHNAEREKSGKVEVLAASISVATPLSLSDREGGQPSVSETEEAEEEPGDLHQHIADQEQEAQIDFNDADEYPMPRDELLRRKVVPFLVCNTQRSSDELDQVLEPLLLRLGCEKRSVRSSFSRSRAEVSLILFLLLGVEALLTRILRKVGLGHPFNSAF